MTTAITRRDLFGAHPDIGTIWVDEGYEGEPVMEDGEIGDRYFVVKAEEKWVLLRPVDDPHSDDFLQVMWQPLYAPADATEFEIWPPTGLARVEQEQVDVERAIVAMAIGSRDNAAFQRLVDKARAAGVLLNYHVPAGSGLPNTIPGDVQLILYFRDMLDNEQKKNGTRVAREFGLPFISVMRSGFEGELRKGLSRMAIKPKEIRRVTRIPETIDLGLVESVPSDSPSGGGRYGAVYANVGDHQSVGSEARWVWEDGRWVERGPEPHPGPPGGPPPVHDAPIDVEWYEERRPVPQAGPGGVDRGAIAAWLMLGSVAYGMWRR